MNKDKNLYPVKKNTQPRNNHHLLEFKNQFLTPNKKSQPLQPLNELKPRINAIKINKAKLPADFFPKCWSFEKKLPHFKLTINQNQSDSIHHHQNRKVQSQRLHISPQKTSFFGFFEQQTPPHRHPQSKTLAIKRKFETRQEPKRDNSQMKRRFTPGSNMHRNELFDLFPNTYDQHMTQIITSNSSARINKLSPRKQYQSKYQQLVHDPQKEDTHTLGMNTKYEIPSNHSKNLINLKTIQKSSEKKIKDEVTLINSQTVDLHNMTFFNAKSTCLPPIKKI